MTDIHDIQLWPDWKIARFIGQGSFGEVYEIHRQNGPYLERAALKVIRIPKESSELEQLRREGLGEEDIEGYFCQYVEDVRNEIGLMQQFVGYSNIVSYEDYLIQKHRDTIGWDILIRMELLTALSDYMADHTLTEKDVVQIGLDISRALEICHKEKIIHRDIKPQNIFVNKLGYYKLGDFGISRPMPGNGSALSFKGSIPYMAPEIFAMKDTDARSDIYSLALVLYRILNGGREPFLSSSTFTPDEKETAQKRRMAGETLPPPSNGSAELWGVLAKALSVNPEERYQSAAEFHTALEKTASKDQMDTAVSDCIAQDLLSEQDIAADEQTAPLGASGEDRTEAFFEPGIKAGHNESTEARKGQSESFVNFRPKSTNEGDSIRGRVSNGPDSGKGLNSGTQGQNGSSHFSKRFALALAGALLLLLIVIAALMIPHEQPEREDHKADDESGLSKTETLAVSDSDGEEKGESVEAETGSETDEEESGSTNAETDSSGAADQEGNAQAGSSGKDTDHPMDPHAEEGVEVEAEDSEEPAVINYNTKGTVRILNKKNKQHADFERLAGKFEQESGIKVEVESPATGKYSKTLEKKIPGVGDAPTLFMLTGQTDLKKYGSECLELTNCAAAGELADDSYTLKGQNGKVYGLACIVEAYGLCVNTKLLKKAGYEISDIQSFPDLKNVVLDITRRKDELGFSAFTSPSVGIGISGDYRFAEHAPAVPLFYELKDNDFNIGVKLKSTYMDCFRNFIDLYLDNATVPRSQASSKSLEDAQKEFLEGKAVFHQDGSWDYGRLKALMGDQATVIPLYMGMPGEKKQGLNKTCSYYWCVNKAASKDDIEASLQFLYWMATSEEGIRIMTEDMDFQIPYRKAEVPDNKFFQVLHKEEEGGYQAINQYYKYGHYNTWINNIRRAIRNYADGTGNWAAVEDAFKTLW